MEEHVKQYKNDTKNAINLFLVILTVSTLIKVALGSGGTYNSAFLATFSIIFFAFMFVTNMSITRNKLICGKHNARVSILSTVPPFLFVFLVGVLVLASFPGWKRCFANTFGTWIVWAIGLSDLIGEKSKTKFVGEGATSDQLLYAKINKEPLVIFNELTTEGITKDNIEREAAGHGGWGQYGQLGLTEDRATMMSVFKYVNMKNDIGQSIWLGFLGVITLLVGFNSILAENCNAFTQNKAEFQNYLNNKLKKN